MARLNTNWSDTKLFKLSGLLHITLPAFWTMERLSRTSWMFTQHGLKDRDDWGAVYITFRTLEIDDPDERLKAHTDLLTGGMHGISGDMAENLPGAEDVDPEVSHASYVTCRAAPIVQGLGLVGFRLEIKRDRAERAEFIALMEQLHPEFYRAEMQVTGLLPGYGHALENAPYRAPFDPESPGQPGALPPGMEEMAEREVDGLARVRMPIVWEEHREQDLHRCFIEPEALEPNGWGSFFVTAEALGFPMPPGGVPDDMLQELFQGLGAELNAAGDLWLTAVEDPSPSHHYDAHIDWAASVRSWRWARIDGFDGGAQITTFSLTIEFALMDRPEFRALVAAMEAAAFSAKVYPGELL